MLREGTSGEVTWGLWEALGPAFPAEGTAALHPGAWESS